VLTVGSLFAGIGGFDLGLERAGMRSVWQCEIDPFCQRVLAKHWPDVLRVPDIRAVGAGTVPYVDVIAGGFPCQDLSSIGKRAGIDGPRSGLWSEYARVVGELRPRYVLVENVAALRYRGLDRVVGDLAALGYDAEWRCIRASDVGAPHRRDRLWLVAFPHVADTPRPVLTELKEGRSERERARASCQSSGACEDCAPGDQWLVEPDVGRVADGVPARVDRLRGLNNALVPQIAEWIGRRILDYERSVSDAALAA
jgi:DNA (cytosine-5)-methyltransferase 1